MQADASELERIEDLLDQFNVFEAIGFIGQEVMHSRFLSFLLDPKGGHGLDDLFLRSFLRKCSESTDADSLPQVDHDGGSLHQTEVRTEVHTGDGRIDILLLNYSGEWAVIVENKIWTTEHSDQLVKYYRFVKEHYRGWQVQGIYLTPYGDRPTHKKYLPLSYGAVCEVLDSILTERGSTVSSDVRMAIQHYTDMLRRHIVGDSEIARLCQQIYQKHRRAFDLIYEHRPDVQAEIRDFLKALVERDSKVVQDFGGKTFTRFSVQGWDTPALLTSSGWTRSGRILIFEFWNTNHNLTLNLVVGPGPEEIRQKLFGMARANSETFDDPWKAVGAWYVIYSNEFLNGEMHEEASDREEEIRKRWDEFLHRDLPRIEEAVKSETWIWEPVETDPV